MPVLPSQGPPPPTVEILRSVGKTARPEPSGERILLRVFCHAHGDRIVLLLGGYDKGADPSPKRQQREIASARKRLKNVQRRMCSRPCHHMGYGPYSFHGTDHL